MCVEHYSFNDVTHFDSSERSVGTYTVRELSHIHTHTHGHRLIALTEAQITFGKMGLLLLLSLLAHHPPPSFPFFSCL